MAANRLATGATSLGTSGRGLLVGCFALLLDTSVSGSPVPVLEVGTTEASKRSQLEVVRNISSVPHKNLHVDTVLESIRDGPDLLVPELLTDGRSPVVQVGHPIDGLHGETESIGLVLDGEFERGVDVSLFPVTTDVDVAGSVPPVGESVDEPGVRVEVDNDGLVSGEDAVEFLVRQACRAMSKRLVKGIISTRLVRSTYREDDPGARPIGTSRRR
jgi:hypothetical protein